MFHVRLNLVVNGVHGLHGRLLEMKWSEQENVFNFLRVAVIVVLVHTSKEKYSKQEVKHIADYAYPACTQRKKDVV